MAIPQPWHPPLRLSTATSPSIRIRSARPPCAAIAGFTCSSRTASTRCARSPEGRPSLNRRSAPRRRVRVDDHQAAVPFVGQVQPGALQAFDARWPARPPGARSIL